MAIIQALDSPELAHLLPLLVQGLLDSLEPREAMDYIIVFLTYLSKATQRLKQEGLEHAKRQLHENTVTVFVSVSLDFLQRCHPSGVYGMAMIIVATKIPPLRSLEFCSKQATNRFQTPEG